ncbi:hypothetical protein HJC23_012366 [Cyclotella cryptica]|uniref:3-methyl-2-oxobutanoate hydroxymethyltransferase n=1 Tax=Cyclotella cryptica TaxID=29204 RepID=A0ABD3QK14_9STRA|eukprot:CCRYP_006577-RC/>CCRYP_006577-RC protein AED:0.16 eAED:0.16 QI:282/1/1/1/0.75/0.6/5/2699/454
MPKPISYFRKRIMGWLSQPSPSSYHQSIFLRGCIAESLPRSQNVGITRCYCSVPYKPTLVTCTSLQPMKDRAIVSRTPGITCSNNRLVRNASSANNAPGDTSALEIAVSNVEESSSAAATTTATGIPKKPKKVTTLSLASKKRRGHKITMVTAYDYPSAVHVDRAGIDVVLVGDSCAMVELGFDTTQPITLDQMIHHCQAVKRGAPSRPLLVGDMPFGSYEFEDRDVALKNAYRMVKEGGMDAVKFEGGSTSRAKIVKHVVEGGVAVLGHIGLTPQAISVLGGFRAQGRTAIRARALLDEAIRLQDAGAFAIVLECIPSNVAAAITEVLEIPTIGIGAGGGTSGQVLVFHDLLGMLSHPHHEEFVPKFCKQYARVGMEINDGLAQFKQEVEDGTFPGQAYAPYVMTEAEEKMFNELMAKDAAMLQTKHDEVASKLKQADEYEQLNLYGNGKTDP